MKLLFDENLSPSLPQKLDAEFPGSCHVRSVGLLGADDLRIWEYASRHGFVIISKDTDFCQLSFLKGLPPKVIWLSIGNAGTDSTLDLIRDNFNSIRIVESGPDEGLLIIESGEDA